MRKKNINDEDHAENEFDELYDIWYNLYDEELIMDYFFKQKMFRFDCWQYIR